MKHRLVTWKDIEKLVPPWRRGEPEKIGDARIFSLERVPSWSPHTGQPHDFFRLKAPHWVNVIALTPDGGIILVVQQRHGIAMATLEIPAGLVDPGEDPEKAALRELEEETGYIPREVIHLGTCYPNPAFLTNLCYTFLAKDCTHTGRLSRDTTEELEVLVVPAEEINSLLTSGMLGNAMGIVGLFWYDLYLRGIPWCGDRNMRNPGGADESASEPGKREYHEGSAPRRKEKKQ
ncbi:MAG: NUDIX hydrolase [Candidatus Eremiobacteraeota bacterium]|nr:NUDIX hydrolase [Candidatus Eremiobacteraeota bacterium]